ncbi:MAG: CtsR family transcriptional regulator [Clostridia bacterium]|nr:CtsR family transcriptional regulator [Clostridia bacterium]
MATVSDGIEKFILSNMDKDSSINLSRNELADFFKCAPSQINYVLTTRFNLNRGYIIQSRRGGGGFIKLEKIQNFNDNYIFKLIDENLSNEISFRDAIYLLEDLVGKQFLTLSQAKIISYAISDKALSSPIKIDGILRVGILKNILINILKEKKSE